MAKAQLELSLEAVIVSVVDDTPKLLTISSPEGLPALPSGLLQDGDRTIEEGLRRWVQEQTSMNLGYVEQLYTFGDKDRVIVNAAGESQRNLSISYLALVHQSDISPDAEWLNFYDFFPWEDHRLGAPQIIESTIKPKLEEFAAAVDGDEAKAREIRSEIMFASSQLFDGVRALERYELLFEAGLLPEAGRAVGDISPVGSILEARPMFLDHRRIAATALSRLRGKLTYRPVVFELLPKRFSLLQLQTVVEALSGFALHKQNFRRLVESAGLVQGTGEMAKTGGRPAELFEFRHEVLRERPRPGIR